MWAAAIIPSLCKITADTQDLISWRIISYSFIACHCLEIQILRKAALFPTGWLLRCCSFACALWWIVKNWYTGTVCSATGTTTNLLADYALAAGTMSKPLPLGFIEIHFIYGDDLVTLFAPIFGFSHDAPLHKASSDWVAIPFIRVIFPQVGSEPFGVVIQVIIGNGFFSA